METPESPAHFIDSVAQPVVVLLEIDGISVMVALTADRKMITAFIEAFNVAAPILHPRGQATRYCCADVHISPLGDAASARSFVSYFGCRAYDSSFHFADGDGYDALSHAVHLLEPFNAAPEHLLMSTPVQLASAVVNDIGRRWVPADLPARHEYATLNAIRGIAAIGVVLFHGVALVGTIVPRGYLAVDLFFVLSGFVIAHAYGNRLADGLSFRAFAQARLIRFWPLYALGLTLGMGRESLLLATDNDFALPLSTLLAAALAGLCFVPFPLARRGGDLFPLNIPSWSLFFELLVNLIYAVMRPVLGPRALASIILVSAIAFVAMVPSHGIGHVGVSIGSFAAGCVRTLLSFTIGLLIHRLQPHLPMAPAPLLLILAAAALMFPWGGMAYDLIFILLLGPLIVIMGASTEPSANFARFAKWLGVMSFPLYAVHRPVLGLAEAITVRVALSPWFTGWLTVAALLAISAPLAHLYDAPVRERAARFLRRRLRSDPATAAVP